MRKNKGAMQCQPDKGEKTHFTLDPFPSFFVGDVRLGGGQDII